WPDRRARSSAGPRRGPAPESSPGAGSVRSERRSGSEVPRPARGRGAASGTGKAIASFVPLVRCFEQAHYDRRHALPALGFRHQLLAAGTGERVILGAAVVVRGPPFGRNPAPLFQPQQSRVKRALVQV